jgi:cellulose synthase/poly-beta-1,6-N-acetylglucosamine synthase-like glycosyltransferase
MQKAAKDFPNVIAKRNVANQGKALTMIDAAKASRGEILVGIDSDCVFDPNSIREMVACFPKNPKLAGVGGRVGVLNTNQNWLTQIQAVFYLTSFLFIKVVENIPRKIQCLSGPLVALRRERYMELIPEITKRTFLGAKITNGEDRALTQMLLRRGWDTYVNLDAVCWTSVPSKLNQYIMQQLRWRRSAIGQWLEAIYNLPKLIKNSTFFSVLFSLAPVYVIIVWILLLVGSALLGNLLYILLSILVFHVVISPIIILSYLSITKNFKYEKIDNISKFIPTFFMSIFWFPVSGLIITTVALCSLDDGGWVTRT